MIMLLKQAEQTFCCSTGYFHGPIASLTLALISSMHVPLSAAPPVRLKSSFLHLNTQNNSACPCHLAANFERDDMMMQHHKELAAQRGTPQADIAAVSAPVARLIKGLAAAALPHAVAGCGVDHYAPLLGCTVHKRLLRIHLHN